MLTRRVRDHKSPGLSLRTLNMQDKMECLNHQNMKQFICYDSKTFNFEIAIASIAKKRGSNPSNYVEVKVESIL